MRMSQPRTTVNAQVHSPEPGALPCSQVKPYHFDFSCSVKRRQAGKSVIDILVNEFSSRSRAYYEEAFRDGRLRIEGATKRKITYDASTPLGEGVRIRHLVHRHEPPVPNTEVKLIEEDDDYFVVCKPAGMPVHSGGQYRKNTVMGIVEATWPGVGWVAPAHRLDRPVSGVLICTKNKETARNVLDAITSGDTKKVYVARVLGRVEQETIDVDAPLYYDFGMGKAVVGVEGVDKILSDFPENGIETKRRNNDVNVAGGRVERTNDGLDGPPQADGPPTQSPEVSTHHHRTTKRAKKSKVPKEERRAIYVKKSAEHKNERIFRPARTIVRLIGHSKDGRTSLVECQPITGRTHQIRAHLAHIGHPIANDASYGGTIDGHVNTGDLARTLGLHRRLDEPSADSKEVYLNGVSTFKVDVKIPEEDVDPACPHCPYYVARDYPVDWTPLWLHALRYSICGRSFQAPYPKWVEDDVEVHPTNPK